MNSKVNFALLSDKIWPLSVDFQLNKSDNTLVRAASSRHSSSQFRSVSVGFDENKRVKSEIVKGEILNFKNL